MCLAVPAKILERNSEQARVDSNGLELDVDVSLVPEAQVGDFVIVHVGIALSVMNSEDAEQTLSAHRELVQLQVAEDEAKDGEDGDHDDCRGDHDGAGEEATSYDGDKNGDAAANDYHYASAEKIGTTS